MENKKLFVLVQALLWSLGSCVVREVLESFSLDFKFQIFSELQHHEHVELLRHALRLSQRC